MSNFTQDRFYYIPKERLANLFQQDHESIIDANGAIMIQKVANRYATPPTFYYTITLSDYIVPQHVVRTPEMQAYVGMMGTHAFISSDDSSWFYSAKSALDRLTKQFEM